MKKILFCIAVFGSLLSCSSDNENLSSKIDAIINKGNDVFTFSYNGKTYSSLYDSSSDLLVLNDSSINVLFNKIQELPELATYVRKDGSIEFYDKYNDLKKVLDGKSTSSLKSTTGRALAVKVGQIFLYEHPDRGGRFIPFDVTDSGLNVPDIGGAINFNDKLSSFDIKLDVANTFVVTLFRDQNYLGRSIAFDGPSAPTGLYIRNLHDYVMTRRFLGAIYWHDQMTSFKVMVN